MALIEEAVARRFAGLYQEQYGVTIRRRACKYFLNQPDGSGNMRRLTGAIATAFLFSLQPTQAATWVFSLDIYLTGLKVTRTLVPSPVGLIPGEPTVAPFAKDIQGFTFGFPLTIESATFPSSGTYSFATVAEFDSFGFGDVNRTGFGGTIILLSDIDGIKTFTGADFTVLASDGMNSYSLGAPTFAVGLLTESGAQAPEPQSWVTMLAGFALVGGALRLRLRSRHWHRRFRYTLCDKSDPQRFG